MGVTYRAVDIGLLRGSRGSVRAVLSGSVVLGWRFAGRQPRVLHAGGGGGGGVGGGGVLTDPSNVILLRQALGGAFMAGGESYLLRQRVRSEFPIRAVIYCLF